jgi:arsenate reductase
MVQIYHNPRCAKSRETLAILEQKKVKPEIILYLEQPPSKKELKAILEKLGMKASELIRKGEAIYKEQYKSKTLTEAQWIQAMIDHPKLIERPIVIKGQKAVLGRPPENVLEII